MFGLKEKSILRSGEVALEGGGIKRGLNHQGQGIEVWKTCRALYKRWSKKEMAALKRIDASIERKRKVVQKREMKTFGRKGPRREKVDVRHRRKGISGRNGSKEPGSRSTLWLGYAPDIRKGGGS